MTFALSCRVVSQVFKQACQMTELFQLEKEKGATAKAQ
jgi:hypothetical protein